MRIQEWLENTFYERQGVIWKWIELKADLALC